MKKLSFMKWVSLCVVVSLCLLSLAACSSNDDKGKQTEPASQGKQTEQGSVQEDKKLEDYTEEMKLTAYQGSNYAGPTNSSVTEYAKYVKKKFKINVDEYVWPAGEDVNKKLSLFAASGQMPDTVQTTTDSASLQILNQMSDAGMLLDIEPYLKKSPNVMKYLTQPIIDAYRNPGDGKLYVLPGFTINPDLKDELTIAVNNVLMVREDWLKQLKLDVPKTPDEFYEVLKAFKTLPAVNGKKVIPYLPLWGGNEINSHIGSMFGIWQYRTTVDENAQRMVDYHEKPEYLEYLKFASKLFREGLIYPEAYKMKWQEAYNDILPKGYAGIANMWPSEIAGLTTLLEKNDPNAKYVPMPLPKAPGVQNNQLERINTLGGSGIVISSKVKDPERLFKYIDWMATKEGWATMTFGPPSKDNGTWYIDENGKFIDNEELQKKKAAEIPRWSADVLGAWAYGLPGVLKYSQNLLMDKARKPEPLRELAKQQYANDMFIDTVYDIFMNSEPGPVRIAKGIDLDKIFSETEARIIMQSKDDADVEKMYASMMTEAEKAGFTGILKEDYVRYMAVKEKYSK